MSLETEDFLNSKFPDETRRSSDAVLVNILKTMQEQHGTLVRLEGAINSIRQDAESAFMRDSLGKPDFAGHRMAHEDMKVAANNLKDYKVDFTKNLIRIVIGGAIAIALFGLDSYVRGVVQGQGTKQVK